MSASSAVHRLFYSESKPIKDFHLHHLPAASPTHPRLHMRASPEPCLLLLQFAVHGSAKKEHLTPQLWVALRAGANATYHTWLNMQLSIHQSASLHATTAVIADNINVMYRVHDVLLLSRLYMPLLKCKVSMLTKQLASRTDVKAIQDAFAIQLHQKRTTHYSRTWLFKTNMLIMLRSK